jgi:cell division inhibitor SepF
MAGLLRKAGEYLGLVDVGDYDDPYEDGYGYAAPGGHPGYDPATGAPLPAPAYAAAAGTVGGGHVEPAYPATSPRGMRPVAMPPGPATSYAPPQPLAPPGPQRITTVAPRAYNDAKHIGEQFRSGVPVIMNLDGMEDADARRLVDFAAGLTFGLHGDLQRVTRGVFLLRPEGVQVALDDGGGVVEGGFYNQS